MRQLLRTALFASKHRLLIIATVLSMILLTLASQLEVIAMGVITKKGPDFFELFAPIENGTLKKTNQVSLEEVEKRWEVIAKGPSKPITPEKSSRFLSKYKGRDLLESVISFIEKWIPISTNLKALAFFLVLVALLKAFTLFFQRFSSKLVAIRVSRDLRQAFFEHIQLLPMSFYQEHNIGSLSSRVVGDAALIAEALNACLVNYLQTPFTIFSTLALCFAISWKLSMIIFLGFPAIVIPIVILAKRVKRISKQIQKNQEKFASVLIDFLSGIQTVKIFSMEKFSLQKYVEQNNKMAVLEEKSAKYDLSSRPIVHTIGMFFLATALLYGLYVLQMNVSEVLVYCGLLYVFYEPVKKFAEENTHIQRGIAAAERMQEVLNIQPVEKEGELSELKGFHDKITFENVSFKYHDKWVLKNLNMEIKKGEMVAIVGPTGSGKSTIAQLLPKLYEVNEGAIKIDGVSIREYGEKSLREAIAFVPQKPFLFLDTVKANIAYGTPHSFEEIQTAAKLAEADEFIMHLPQGYDTELAEGGKNLSGGQQQRLAVARAFVKKAPILILDEATSSLDAISENKIKIALEGMKGKITQIIIAHRFSTIEDADRIIYIEKGEKIGEGSKDELLKTCPPFKKMWEMLYSEQNE